MGAEISKLKINSLNYLYYNKIVENNIIVLRLQVIYLVKKE